MARLLGQLLLSVICTAGLGLPASARAEDGALLPWSGPVCVARASGPLITVPQPGPGVGTAQSDHWPFDEWDYLPLSHRDAAGRAVYVWDLEWDLSREPGVVFEPGESVPATLLIAGTVEHDYGTILALAYQGLCLDATRPCRLSGTLTLERPAGEAYIGLLYGADAEATRRLLLEPDYSKPRRGHYSDGEDYGLTHKQLTALGGGRYRYAFAVGAFEEGQVDRDLRESEYTVTLYDAQGWEVASHRSRHTGGFEKPGKVTGVIEVPAGLTAHFIRVEGPWSPIEP
jgi:hypothetical protein